MLLDKVALFERRYKEGYNIFVDEDYVTLNSVVDAFSYVSPLHSISGSRKFVEPANGGSNSPEAEVHAQPSTSVTTPKSAENLSSKKISPISKDLTLPNLQVKKSTGKFCASTGASVLTSAKCLAIIREKEEKRKRKRRKSSRRE